MLRLTLLRELGLERLVGDRIEPRYWRPCILACDRLERCRHGAVPGNFRGAEFTKRLKRFGDEYYRRNGRSPWYVVFDFDLGEHIKRADVATTPTYESWYA